MEPFRVTCETCRARLKVRDASAIGEIHSCPKCGSMVHILPPQGWSAERAPVAAAAVLAVADLPEPDFAHVPPPSDELADMFEAAAAAVAAPVAAAAPAVVDVAAETLAPSAAPTAAGSPLALWTVVGAAAIVIGGLTVAFWPDSAPSSDQPRPVATAAAPAPATPIPSPDENALAASEPVVDASIEAHAVAKPASDDYAPGAGESDTAPVELPDEEVADSTVAGDETADQSQEAGVEITALTPSSPVANNDPPREAILKFDPLDFDPAQFSIGTSTPARTPATSVDDEPPGEAASAGATPTESPDGDSDILQSPPANPTITVRLGPVADAAHPSDIPGQLGLEVESLEVTSMPLGRLIETLSAVSGLPITLDPLALELAGSSARGEVAVTARSATLAELMRDALRKSRLTYVEKDGHVIIALPDADRRISREFDFGDLMEAGAADAAGVAQLIQTFVAPESWNASGGTGSMEVHGSKLRIDQRKAVHHEMLLFCERLRLTRGMPRKSKYPSELLTVDSPYVKMSARLAEKTTFTFLPWTRLADVLQQWQESSGVTMLVDWHRTADLELGASTPLACSVIDRSWEEVLDEVLDPLGLAWWVVNGTTIQITSREALVDTHRVEFYEISKAMRDQFANESALVEALQADLREELGVEVAAAEQLRMQLDKPSRRLIVRGTPPVHRYLAKRLAVPPHGAAR